MADNINEQVPVSSGVETTDRGLFGFMKKDKKEDDKSTLESEFDHKAHVSEAEYKKDGEDDKKHGVFADKHHRSHSSSSSSSEDEADDEEKKKRKREKKEKKGLKEKLQEKLPGHKNEHPLQEKLPGHKNEHDTNVPIEKYEEKPHPHVQEVTYSEPSHPEDKGLLDKVKDKLPGHKKVDEHHGAVSAPAPTSAPVVVEGEKDKKGFLDKIKDKIPGFSSKTGEEKKEHDEK